MSDLLTYKLEGSVGVIQLDDGKVNALSHQMLDAIESALDRAEDEAQAVAFLGREGRFCGGFDLSVMRQGGSAVGELVGHGARLGIRLYEFSLPIVIGCTGHALAMGAILLLSADKRLAAEGEYKIGMNEVAIGMTLPRFAIDFARDRLSKRHLTRATLEAEIYSPAGAVDAGFLDELVPVDGLWQAVVDEAERLGSLSSAAHHQTKMRLRSATIGRMRAELEEDMSRITAPQT